MAKQTVGDSGSILQHFQQLVTALKAGDVWEAFRLLADIWQHLNADPDARPIMMSGAAVPATSGDPLAALEAAVNQRATVGAAAGAWPWREWLALAIEALLKLLKPVPA